MTAYLTRLLLLCIEAEEADTAQLLEEEAAFAAQNTKLAQLNAEIFFGAEAAVALGVWRPTDTPPEGALQAYVRITADVYLRHTAMPTADSVFEVVANCDACGHAQETTVSSLAELAVALFAVGVSR